MFLNTVELVNVFLLQTIFDGKMKRNWEMNQCSRKMLTSCWMSAWLMVKKKDELKRMQELEIRGKKVRHFSLGTITTSNQTTPVWGLCFKARWQKSCTEESSEPELQIAFRKARFFVIQLCHKHSHACGNLSKTSVSDLSFAGERKAVSPNVSFFIFKLFLH